MMITAQHRYTREIRGPQPNSFALIARAPNKQSSGRLLEERRMKEQQAIEQEEIDKINQWNNVKNDWVTVTDQKIKANNVRRRFQTLLRQNEEEIEQRRQRLRELLQRENEQYRTECANSQTTLFDRQNEMKERARQLRERRDAERHAIVQQKLEQQFREGCEELRTTVSRRHTQEVAFERLDQVRMKEDMEKARKREEEAFAKIWYADAEARARKEEMDTQRQLSANRDTVAFLQQQMAALDAKRQQEKQLIEEEARLMKEEDALLKMEKDREDELKRQKQREAREMYAQTVQMKRAQEEREMKEQAAFDMKLLEQLLEQTNAEAALELNKKKHVRDEERRYREHLRVIKAEEARREAELERMCDAEVERNWEKRIQQWKQEKVARQKLLEEVMESRRVQLIEKFEANLLLREEAKKERELLLQTIANNRRVDQEVKDRLIALNGQHQRDLIGQIAYNKRQRKGAAEEDQRMWAVQRGAEVEFLRKVEDLRNRPVLDKIHPMRRAHVRFSPSSAHF